MEIMNELLEKYFKGETSVCEENELKQYFKAGNVSSELKIYSTLFDTFDSEALEKAVNPLKKLTQRQRKPIRIWIRSFAYTGIAASLMLFLFIKYPFQVDNYAVVSGNKIEDTEFAEKYVEKKLNHVNDMLNKSMRPLNNSFENVRNDLQPMNKLINVKEKMEKIQNTIQIK